MQLEKGLKMLLKRGRDAGEKQDEDAEDRRTKMITPAGSCLRSPMRVAKSGFGKVKEEGPLGTGSLFSSDNRGKE